MNIWNKIDKTDGCWNWLSNFTSAGYGQISQGRKGKRLYAHRRVYELLVGPIPAGMDIHHKCRNRRCVNPAHLEILTRSEHMRQPHVKKEKCRVGHSEFGTERDGSRFCRICARVRARDWARKQRKVKHVG